jgi:N-acetylgalactosamine-N,N'-diacetylbacillosaminyl-diphospho-undecaprenol 4-alpha-N-acetylgalactosaminyltransferase
MLRYKIAFLINSLTPGGAERVMSLLLQNLQCNEFDVELIMLEDDIVFDIPEHIKVTILSKHKSEGKSVLKTLSIPWYAMKLGRYIQKEDIKIVVSFLYRADFVNIIASGMTNHKTIVSQRVNASSTYNDNGIVSRIYRYLIRTLYPRADMVLNVSEGTKYDLAENFGIDLRKQKVIYNPYEIEKIISLAKEPIDLPLERENTIVVVAWLRKVKNIGMIIEVFSMLDPKMQLVIVGSGEEEELLKRKAEDLGLLERVYFVGSDKNPYRYMARASIYVSASYAEGFPNAMVEAMLCKCAVVVTDCLSGPREILAPRSDPHILLKDQIEYAPFGVLYPVGNSKLLKKVLVDLIENPEKKRKISEQGYQRAHDFDMHEIVARYCQILHEVK